MKHLRIFESQEYEVKELDRLEWEDEYEDNEDLNLVAFKQSDFNQIRKLVSSWGATFRISAEYCCSIDWDTEKYKNSISAYLSFDDWIWVTIDSVPKPRPIGDNSFYRRYFKCDQLGGLFRLIETTFKDVKKIKNPEEFIKTEEYKSKIYKIKWNISNLLQEKIPDPTKENMDILSQIENLVKRLT